MKQTLDYVIKHTPSCPPESGGILGGRNGIVSYVEFDVGSRIQERDDVYIPDTDRLNTVIAHWERSNTEFMGIFHSHAHGNEALSKGDRRYIEVIMSAMPEDITDLYFPIVLPKQKMIVYRAYKANDKVTVNAEELEEL